MKVIWVSGGINLSGGQKQRITIARALAINPNIIILDDCLSAVDARVEQTIIRNILKKFPDRTLLVVTHRLPAIRDFDMIVVMQDGMIVEKGSHEQLIKNQWIVYILVYERSVKRSWDSYGKEEKRGGARRPYFSEERFKQAMEGFCYKTIPSHTTDGYKKTAVVCPAL